MPIVVSDTAGIREAAGKIEQEGIRADAGAGERRRPRAVDGGRERTSTRPRRPSSRCAPRRMLVVVNKFDLLDSKIMQPLPEGAIAVSALTGFGLDRLTLRLAGFARARIGTRGRGDAGADPGAPSPAVGALPGGAASFLGSPMEEFELRAEDLRRAALSAGTDHRARWTWRMCWARSSAGSASGSEASARRPAMFHVKQLVAGGMRSNF